MPCTYPPMVRSITKLGYISDVNTIGYSRDIGRSFTLGGHHWIVFGDTFCKDGAGKFVGLTNNTAALLHDQDRETAALSRYQDIDNKGVVAPFIPFLPGEEPLAETGDRITLWNFGGCVELEDRTGRVWFEKCVEKADKSNTYCGTGIAKVTVCHGKLVVDRLRGEHPFSIVFGPEEPRIGSFSTLAHGHFIYLWSNYKDSIILARTHRSVTVLPGAYTFWNGKGWVLDYTEAICVKAIEDAGITQGAIVRSTLFGRKKPFLLIGVDKFADSKIQLGVAEKVEGPWDIQVVGDATGIDKKDGYTYCIYPHLWSSNQEKGELTVTWSEQWPGGVVAAMIKFEMEEGADEL